MDYIKQTMKDAEELENQAIDIFRVCGWGVEDLRKDKNFQVRDIDIRIYDEDYSAYVELKGSEATERTGNVAIEYQNWNNVGRGYQGWYYYCEAEFVGYVFDNAVHVVTFKDLQKAERSAKRKTVHDGIIGLIPVPVLEKMPSYRVIGGI